MGLYSKHIFPYIMEWALSARPVIDLRFKALEQSAGRVLELGFGTGLNIACYPYTINELVAVDSEMMMNTRVQQRIAKSPFPVRRELLDASSRLPFQDQSFDTIVTTFTLCSIKRVSDALKEIQRLLKPGGLYLFLEHGRSDNTLCGRLQDFLNPLQNVVAAGCNLNRKMDVLIKAAGLEISELHRFTMARTPRVFGEIYSGAARRGSTAISGQGARSR